MLEYVNSGDLVKIEYYEHYCNVRNDVITQPNLLYETNKNFNEVYKNDDYKKLLLINVKLINDFELHTVGEVYEPTCSDYAPYILYIGDTEDNMIEVSRFGFAGLSTINIPFIIPPNKYYKIVDNNTPYDCIYMWREYKII